jgi:hypothetical protein
MPSTQTSPRSRRADRAEAARKKQRQTRYAIGAVVVVVAVIVILVLVKVTSGSSSSASGPAPQGVVDKTTSVPVDALVAAQNPNLVANGPKQIDTPPLTADGKPHIVYFGGEFCPYCAADRWVTVVALSQFGQWHDLRVTHSSPTDVSPNTPTFSFHGASYTSPYLAFSGFETQDRAGKPLDSVPTDLQKLPSTVAAAVGDPNFNANSIPFMDIGGKFVQSGAPFSPDILAHKSWQEVADALHVPASPIYQTILANAAELVKDLCTLTNNQPGNVCGAFTASSASTTAPAGGSAPSTTTQNATKLPNEP